MKAHNLVTLHYSDDETDYPALFELWKPVDLERLEQGLLAAAISLKEAKQSLKTDAPHRWREYRLGAWRRRQKPHPELAALYESKLHMEERLLQAWGEAHPDWKLPVAFDNGYTQPVFCQYLDQTLRWPYVGALADNDVLVLQRGKKPVASLRPTLSKNTWRRSRITSQVCFNRSALTTRAKRSITTVTVRRIG